MNIVKMNCPSCGALLAFGDNASEIKCDKCGQVFPIYDKTSERDKYSETEVATTSSNADENKNKSEMQLEDKKRKSSLRIGVLILVFIVLLTVLIGVAANKTNNNSRHTSSYTGTRSVAQSNSDTLTDTQINQLVASALMNEIDRKYDTADPGSCTMRINRIDRTSNSNFIVVYGSVTLYDIYGRTTTGWYDGSGTAFRSFEVKISKTRHTVSDCDIQ